MSNSKKQLVAEVATALASYGYQSYVAKNGEYGFYTDGRFVVSFGGYWAWSLDFNGQYQARNSSDARQVGTGWSIARGVSIPTREEAESYIKALPPTWAVGRCEVSKTTPEQYLATYGASSGFTEYQP